MSYTNLGYKNSERKISQHENTNLGSKTISYDEISEKSFNLKRDEKKKTGILNKVIRKKTSQPREK